MRSWEAEQQQWVVQPLLDAGLELDTIRALVFQLAFEAVVRDGTAPPNLVRTLVADLSPAVQTAWAETIGRMVLIDLPPS